MTRRSKGKPDPLRNNPVEMEKRQRRNTHNGFFGTTAWARRVMWQISIAYTTTMAAQQLATKIITDLEQLERELKTRID